MLYVETINEVISKSTWNTQKNLGTLNVNELIKHKFRILEYKQKEVIRKLGDVRFNSEGELVVEVMKLIDRIDDTIHGRIGFYLENKRGFNENELQTTWVTNEPEYKILSSANKIEPAGKKSYYYFYMNAHQYPQNKFLEYKGYRIAEDKRVLARDFIRWICGNVAEHSYFDDLLLIPFSDSAAAGESCFSGKKICITGKTDVRRESLAFLIRLLGGTFQTAVSSQTDYLVCSDEAKKYPTTKMKKATANGGKIQIISDRDFIKMMPDLPEIED